MMIGKFNRLFARHGKFIFAIITVVIGISFIGFTGTMGLFSGKKKPNSVFVTAFGNDIKNEDLQKRSIYSSLYNFFTRNYFNRPNPSEELVLLAAADQLGIVTSKGEIEKFIKSAKAVQIDGKFNLEKYKGFINNFVVSRKMKESDFYEAVKQGLTLTKVYEYITANVVVSDGEAKEYFNNMYTQISAKVARFNASDYKGSIKTSDDDELAYFEKNKDSYMDPAEYKIVVAKFNFVAFEAVAKKSVTEDEIKAYYESNKNKYKKADKELPLKSVKAKVIAALIKPKVKEAAFNKANVFANEVYASIKDLETITEKVDAFTKLYEATVDAKVGECIELDWFKDGAETIPNVLDGNKISAAAAKIYHEIPVSDAISGKRSAYVLLLKEKKEKAHSSFESVKAKVTEVLRTEEAIKKARDNAREFTAKVTASLEKGEAITTVVGNEKLVALKPFCFKEKPEASVIDRNAIADLANTTGNGKISKARDNAQGAIAVLVESRTAPAAGEFEKKKELVVAELRSKKEYAAMSDFHSWVQKNIK